MDKNWRITIERRDGTFYVADQLCATSQEATRRTLDAYRAKYHEALDGESHWVKQIREITR